MYLRQIESDMPRDPTMVYVPNLAAILPGHWLCLLQVYVKVVAIRDAGFGNPRIVWADTERTTLPPDGGVVHNLRREQIETWRYGALPTLTPAQALTYWQSQGVEV